MEAIPLERRRELLAEYQRLRKVSRRLNHALVETLDKQTINEGGRTLGILRKGVLCFDTEDMASVLMDFCIHQCRPGGRNAVERYLEDSPPADSDEMTLLRAMCSVRYSVFQVRGVYPNFGLALEDLLRDEEGLLVDVSFSQTAERSDVLAGNVFQPGDFWMTTGAALPMDLDTLDAAFEQVERYIATRSDRIRELSPQRHAELAARVIRTCLKRGMAERVNYEDPVVMRGHRAHTLPEPKSPRIGRNDPC
ncbi:MAG: hypothetical protein ACYTG0_24775, partial [Planctomycetota bacterium]